METFSDVAAGYLEQVVLVELFEDAAFQFDELKKKCRQFDYGNI